jgi:hypothetical protein
MSVVAIGTPGRTAAALAKRTRDGSTHQADQNGAISRVEGEGASVDGVPIPATDEPIKIVRASTRFELRIRPRNDEEAPLKDNLILLNQLDEASKLVARVKNATARWLYIRDAAWLDEHPYAGKGLYEWAPTPERERKKGTHRGEIKPAPLTSLAYEYCRHSPDLSRLDGVIMSAATKDVVSRWCGKRFDVLVRQTEGLLHYKPYQPISIPHAACKLALNKDGTALLTMRVLSVSIGGGRTVTLPLVGRDDWQREELRAIATKDWKLGSVIVSRHHEKRGRWFVRLTYTRLVNRNQGDATVVVRRGMRSFLVAAASTGECQSIYDGGDLIAYNKQMMTRRRSLGQNTKRGTMGAGATGHGTKRRVSALIELSDKEARFKANACKRAAHALVLFAQSVKAKEVVYEDFAAPKYEGVFWLLKRWPWNQLSLACQDACEAAGIPARAVIVRTDRRVCPACGYKHAEPPVNVDEGVKTWECFKCSFARGPDQIDVLDMLRVVSGGEAVARVKGKSKLSVPKPPTATENK